MADWSTVALQDEDDGVPVNAHYRMRTAATISALAQVRQLLLCEIPLVQAISSQFQVDESVALSGSVSERGICLLIDRYVHLFDSSCKRIATTIELGKVIL
jgi:hypothetical protein